MGCGAVNPDHVDASAIVMTLNRIYERKELIDSGTYGKVYRCINKLNGQQYALKVVQITAKNKEEAIRQINNLKAEIGVLKKLNHKNIVKYYSFDISEDNKSVQIVLQYAKLGSLKSYIQKNGSFNQEKAAKMTAQILEGLKYLHQQNIVHRDLKCANILIMKDDSLKISDFGTAKSIKISSTEDIAKLCQSLKGTPYYMAPEILRRSGHTISADIWSLGCLVIEMITGKAPWTSLTNNFEQIISYIVSGIHPPFPKDLTNQCECFLLSCFDNVPNQRLTAEQLMKHRWIDRHGLSKNNTDRSINKTKQTISLDRSTRQMKYQQIEDYINQKSKTAYKKKASAKKDSAKPKKEKMATFKVAEQKVQQPLQNLSFQIQVVPHIQPVLQFRHLRNGSAKKGGEGLLISKTTPQVKLPQNLIGQLPQIEQNSIELQALPFKKQESMNSNLATQLRTENSQGGKLIDTFISREERLRYLQQQKKLQQQREKDKAKWQKQLKEGANFLRKQINNRYIS